MDPALPEPGFDLRRRHRREEDLAEDARLAGVSEECRKAVANLRKRCPEAFAAEPLPPGGIGPEVKLGTEPMAALFALSFAAIAGATPGTEGKDGRIIWVRGDDELLVHAQDVRLVPREGFLLVAIPVYTDQTRETEVVVTFATGSPGAPLGLVVATEPVPRGHPIVVEVWGAELTAAAWQTVIAVASRVAAETGVDVDNQALLPAGLVASNDGVAITPQARHPVDREAAPTP